MTAPHRRLLVITLSLAVLLAIMTVAFIALTVQYHELEQAHLSLYSAYEFCDNERWQGHAP